MVLTEGDRYKIDVEGKEYFVHLKKHAVRKLNNSFWWAEAEEGVVIPGWPKVSGRSGILLGSDEDQVEKQLKQNGLVLVVSNWKGGDRKGGVRKGGVRKRRTRRRRQTRRK
jgi:hypothetical protein